MNVRILTETEQFEAIASDWQGLCQRSTNHHYFQTFGWMWAWWTTAGQDSNCLLHVVTLEDDGRLVLIWPLVVKRKGTWRTLQWMGRDGDYGDIIVEDGEDSVDHWLDAAWREICTGTGYDVVLLDQVGPDAAVRSGMPSKVRVVAETSIAPYLTCDDWPDWDSYIASRKPKFRRDLRRHRRRLAEKGKLTCEVITDADTTGKVARWVARTKGEWVKETNRVLRASEDRFVAAAVREAQQAGTLHTTVLKLDGTMIAASLCLHYRDRMYGWLNAFDANWKAYAPGRIIQEEAIRWSFEHGVKVFDTLSGGDRYKFDWTDKASQHDTLVFPRTILGHLYCGILFGRSRVLLRCLYRALPASLRNRIIRRILTR